MKKFYKKHKDTIDEFIVLAVLCAEFYGTYCLIKIL